MIGHLRPLAQIVNGLVDAGFHLERMVEQAAEDVAGAPPEELARFPYLHAFDSESAEYAVMRKLPFTLIIRARKLMPGAGEPC